MDAESIIANFKRAYPNDSIVAYEFKSGGAGSFSGEQLLDISLNNGSFLKVFKLSKSSGVSMDSDQIKVKAFPFVYETTHITDGARRRDILKNKLGAMFPNHNVNVFIFNDSNWSRNNINTKGSTYFEKSYGSEVDVVLT